MKVKMRLHWEENNMLNQTKLLRLVNFAVSLHIAAGS